MKMLCCGEGKNPAIWVGEDYISYSELSRRVEDLSLKLKHLGVKPKHRVAFVAETNLSSVLAFLALLEIGASPCLLSTRIPPGQLDSYVRQARASFLFDCKTCIANEQKEKFLGDEGGVFLFTSGSSGAPKLVSLHVSHFVSSAKGSVSSLGLMRESCYLLNVPLFHVSGLSILFRAIRVGCSIAFTSNLLEGHDRATHISMVPTQLIRVLDQSSPFPRLKCALIGGAQISESLVKRALKRGMPLYLTYGMTEMASQITMTASQDSLIPIHVGKPLAGKEVMLSKEGEILVRGNALFSGYETASGLEKPFIEGGWFATGDLGAWDLNQNLVYLGRKDNLFISGGENIYPEVVEKALGKLPWVHQALVVPMDDREFGQRPVAFVEVEGEMPSKEDLHDLLSNFLPRFSLPIHYLPFPQEVTRGGLKVKRGDLKVWLQRNFLK